MRKVLITWCTSNNEEEVLLSSTVYFVHVLENHLFTVDKTGLEKKKKKSTVLFLEVFTNLFTSFFFLTLLYKDF